MSAGFTPGPWTILPLRGKYYGTEIAIGRNGGKIVVWTSDEGETRPSSREIADGWEGDYGFDHVETAECYANARLIAAAPELYEALSDVLIHCLADIEAEERKDEPDEAALKVYRERRDRAEAALSKARGEQ